MRSITGTGLIVAGLAATLVALLFPLWSYADRSGTGLDGPVVRHGRRCFTSPTRARRIPLVSPRRTKGNR